jgi:hypothetical protein
MAVRVCDQRRRDSFSSKAAVERLFSVVVEEEEDDDDDEAEDLARRNASRNWRTVEWEFITTLNSLSLYFTL